MNWFFVLYQAVGQFSIERPHNSFCSDLYVAFNIESNMHNFQLRFPCMNRAFSVTLMS